MFLKGWRKPPPLARNPGELLGIEPAENNYNPFPTVEPWTSFFRRFGSRP